MLRTFCGLIPAGGVRVGDCAGTITGVTETIELTFEGQTFRAPAEQLPGETSRHTGIELERVRVEIDAVGSDAQDVAGRLIADAASAGGAPLQGAEGRSWVVEQHSSSYSSANPSTTSYSATLRRHEALVATAAELPGSLTLVPERYQESADSDGVLLIKLMVTLTAAEADEIESRVVKQSSTDPIAYFPVIRHAVQETPINLRFGRCYWQQLEDGRRRYLIFLGLA